MHAIIARRAIMHELTLALDLIERVEAIARREGCRRVVAVEVAVGDSCGVDKEALAFAFPEAARGTLAEGARLNFTEASHREFRFVSLEVEDV
jgi:hydrogenase nickel incorporation protein HypA/HybF